MPLSNKRPTLRERMKQRFWDGIEGAWEFVGFLGLILPILLILILVMQALGLDQ